MQNFGIRLHSLKGEQSLKAFAKELGVSDTMLRGYIEKGAVPRQRTLERFARAKGVPVEWLATGEGPRSIRQEAALPEIGTESEHEGELSMQSMVMLPRLAVEASAGSGLIADSEEVEGLVALSRSYLRLIGVDPQHAHVLQASGRSMVPTINDKDVIVIDTSKTTIVGEGIYTLVYGDTVLVKRLRLLRDGGVTIISDNKSEGYGDEFVSRAEIHTLRIVGQVKGQVRAL